MAPITRLILKNVTNGQSQQSDLSTFQNPSQLSVQVGLSSSRNDAWNIDSHRPLIDLSTSGDHSLPRISRSDAAGVGNLGRPLDLSASLPHIPAGLLTLTNPIENEESSAGIRGTQGGITQNRPPLRSWRLNPFP